MDIDGYSTLYHAVYEWKLFSKYIKIEIGITRSYDIVYMFSDFI